MREILLNYDTGIEGIKEFNMALFEMLISENEIILNLSKVKNVDLPTTRVLLAAKKMAMKGNKILSFKNTSDAVKKHLQVVGLIE